MTPTQIEIPSRRYVIVAEDGGYKVYCEAFDMKAQRLQLIGVYEAMEEALRAVRIRGGDWDDLLAPFRSPALDEQSQVTHALLGLNSEAGEVAGEFQKALYQQRSPNRDLILKELADCLYYLIDMSRLMNTTLEDLFVLLYEKLSKRYPLGHYGDGPQK